MCFGLTTQAQYTIADPNFAAALREAIPEAMNGNVLDTLHPSISTLRRLDVEGRSIDSLTGVYYLHSLEFIYAANNQLLGIPTLPASLRSLSLQKNRILNLSGVPETVTSIDISNNPVQFVSALPRALQYLYVNNTPLTYLPRLPDGLMYLNTRQSEVLCIENIPMGPFPSWYTGSFRSELPLVACNSGAVNGYLITDANLAMAIRRIVPTCMNGDYLDTTCSALALVRTISLPNSGLRNINGLQYFRNLAELDIRNNNLDRLPVLPYNLQNLQVSGNQSINCLPNIPSGPFGNGQSSFVSDIGYTLCSGAFTGRVFIPDANFRAAIAAASPNCISQGWLDTTCFGVSDLDVTNRGIVSLEGLQYMNRLKSLKAAGNQIASLPSLPARLEMLSVPNNQLATVSLSGGASLTSLDLRSNPLTAINAWPSAIQVLYVGNTPLRAIPTLPSGLYFLNATQTRLSCLPNIPAGPFPSWYTGSFGNDAGLTVCSGGSGGGTTAGYYTIPDPNFAAALRDIIPSCMNGNDLDTTCTGLSDIITLDVQGRGISSLEGIRYFRNLKTLFAGRNQIIQLPSRTPANLFSLSLVGNPFTALPAIPSTVQSLDVSFTAISSLPANSLPSSLQVLYANRTPNLTSIASLPNTVYQVSFENSALSCLPNIPTGPFPSWWSAGFSNPQNLPLCVPVCNLPAPQVQASSPSYCPGMSVSITASAPGITTFYYMGGGAFNGTWQVNSAGEFYIYYVSGACTSAIATVNIASAVCNPANSVQVDPTFASWLANNPTYASAISQGTWLDTSNTAVRNATSIDCSGSGIVNLNGIQYFRSLRTLYSRSNQLTQIPVLPASLLEISLRNNQISQIASFPAGLESLDLSENPVAQLPPFPFSLRALYLNLMPNLLTVPTIPNGVYYLETQSAQFSCVPNIPTGPFPSWWPGGFTYPQNLPACSSGSVRAADDLQSQGAELLSYGDGGLSTSSVKGSNGTRPLQLWPNPAKDFVQIDGLTIGQTYKIINALGQEVVSKQAIQTSLRLPIDAYAPGMYMLQTHGQVIRWVKP